MLLTLTAAAEEAAKTYRGLDATAPINYEELVEKHNPRRKKRKRRG